MTTLIIARHGNTFTSDQTPTRVGARTDLPLVESGQEQARKIGAWLKENNIYPEIVYSSELQRTKQTAQIAIETLGYKQPIFPLSIFNEIDYGPDENQPEDKVIARIGEQAIKDWDAHATVPNGWQFNPDECIENWKNFAAQHTASPSSFGATEGSHSTARDTAIQSQYDGLGDLGDVEEIILVVTSNGIARFAPHLTGNFEEFARNHKIKLSTGALGILKFEDEKWVITGWDVRP